jgi:ribonuclease HI
MTNLLASLLALEDRLAQGEFDDLLHPDFLEFGQSGRRWTRADVIAELTPMPSPPRREQTELQILSDDLVLLTWLSQRPGQSATWRSSLWQRGGTEGWQIRFHQATATRKAP